MPKLMQEKLVIHSYKLVQETAYVLGHLILNSGPFWALPISGIELTKLAYIISPVLRHEERGKERKP